MVEGEQALHDFGIGEGRGPAVGGEDGFVQLAVRVRQPGGAGVVEIREVCEKSLDAKASDDWKNKDVNRSRKDLDEARHALVEGLRLSRYVHRQAVWLTERFPEGKLADVLGLVKLVDKAEIEKNDWSLTPGRYVGVAPEEVDEDFDFEETMRDLHLELEGLNEEAGRSLRVVLMVNSEEETDLGFSTCCFPHGLRLGATDPSLMGTWETSDLSRPFPGSADIPATGCPAASRSTVIRFRPLPRLRLHDARSSTKASFWA